MFHKWRLIAFEHYFKRPFKKRGKMVVKIRQIFAFLGLILVSISTSQAAQVLFTPALILSEEFTDNLYLDNEFEEDELITAAGVDLTGEILWRTAGITLNYVPTFNSFKENDELNYWRHYADLLMWKEFTRNTRLEVHDTYLRTNDPTDESSISAEEGQPPEPVIETDRNRRGRNEYVTNVSEMRLTHQFGINNSIYGAYRYSVLREIDSAPSISIEDNNISTPQFGLSFNFSPRWGIEIDNSYAMADYKERNDRDEYNGNVRLIYHSNRPFSAFLNYRHTMLDYREETNEDYNIYEPSLGIGYEFQDNARLIISLGYYFQDFESSEDDGGVSISSDITKRWTYPKGYFGITGGSGYVIDDNAVEDNGLDIYYLARIEAGYNFSSRLSGLVYGGYRHDEYPNEVPDRAEQMVTTGLEMQLHVFHWMTVGITYEFNDLSSDREIDTYTENRALMTMRMEPISPLRFN